MARAGALKTLEGFRSIRQTHTGPPSFMDRVNMNTKCKSGESPAANLEIAFWTEKVLR